jgi:ELWxxDGT repeat protein
MPRHLGLFFAAVIAAMLAIGASQGVAATKPVLVKDVNAGARSSDLHDLTNVDGSVLFSAFDVAHGFELWKSDGTGRGTKLVKDINPGAASSEPHELTNVDGTLFFVADDGIHAYELWKSDGTAAGTTLVKGSSRLQPLPRSLTNVNGTLFFAANDYTDPDYLLHEELWKSDGTAAGTTLVKDINPGESGSRPEFLTNVNGTLFFSAYTGEFSFELWESDGTAAGTTLVKDINPGPWNQFDENHGGSRPQYLANVAGTLFFDATDGIRTGIWTSDGTAAGTTFLQQYFGREFTDVSGTALYAGGADSSGIELWKSDGTAAGTTLVKDINPGPAESQPRFLANIHGTLFFNARGGMNGLELWKSDGTAAGTALVKDINPGAASSFPSDERGSLDLQNPLTDVNGTLFFDADDGIHGLELWKSDGTARGTTMVGDIKPGAGWSLPGAWSRELVNVDGTLFFAADDGTHGFELWKTKPSIREAKPKSHR